MSLRLLVPAAAQALREAEDGLTLQELGAAIGTRWPGRIVEAMQGRVYKVSEQHGRLYLTHDAERTASNPPDQPGDRPMDGGATARTRGSKAPGVSGDAGLISRASASGSLNADVDDGRGEDQDQSLSPGLAGRLPAAVVNTGTLFGLEPERPRSPYDLEAA